MLVDLQWVRMAKKRLAMIDAWDGDDIQWISNGETAVPVAPMLSASNTELAVHARFEVKDSE